MTKARKGTRRRCEGGAKVARRRAEARDEAREGGAKARSILAVHRYDLYVVCGSHWARSVQRRHGGGAGAGAGTSAGAGAWRQRRHRTKFIIQIFVNFVKGC